jgi:regulator of replication initiation timing
MVPYSAASKMMMSDTNKQILHTTEELLHELLSEVRKMKSDYRQLQSENERLKVELKNSIPSINGTSNGDDLFAMNSAEKMAFRQKVLGLIERIDKHLPGGAG